MRSTPASIAIIPDGNRRFAKRAGVSQTRAYVQGFRNVAHAIKWANARDVQSITFWALSLENFSKRTDGELSSLFKLFEKHLTRALSEASKKAEGRVRFFGRLDLLPKALVIKMRALERKTAKQSGIQVNVAVAYSGHEELANAARLMAMDAKSGKLEPRTITPDVFASYLYLQEPTDLVIRTGNVQRTSGFLPWSADYSELYFSPKLWPEFTEKDFDAAIQFYNDTDRRFGK